MDDILDSSLFIYMYVPIVGVFLIEHYSFYIL